MKEIIKKDSPRAQTMHLTSLDSFLSFPVYPLPFTYIIDTTYIYNKKFVSF